jgi:hypothetical protein
MSMRAHHSSTAPCSESRGLARLARQRVCRCRSHAPRAVEGLGTQPHRALGPMSLLEEVADEELHGLSRSSNRSRRHRRTKRTEPKDETDQTMGSVRFRSPERSQVTPCPHLPQRDLWAGFRDVVRDRAGCFSEHREVPDDRVAGLPVGGRRSRRHVHGVSTGAGSEAGGGTTTLQRSSPRSSRARRAPHVVGRVGPDATAGGRVDGFAGGSSGRLRESPHRT